MTISNAWSISSGIALKFPLIAVVLVTSVFGNGRLDPSTIAPGERARFAIEIENIPADVSEDDIAVFDDLLLQNRKLQILDKTHKLENGKFTLTYDLTGYKVESLTIPPIQIRYGANTASSEAARLDITTTRGAEDQEMRPEFGELRTPLPWLLIVKGLLILLASYALFYFLREWFSKIPWDRVRFDFGRKGPPAEKPLEWLRQQLVILRKRIEEGEDSDSLVDDWSLILRTYYHKDLKLPVQCYTLQEIERHQSAKPFLSFLSECDRFRYSPNKEGSARELVIRCFSQTEKVLVACGS